MGGSCSKCGVRRGIFQIQEEKPLCAGCFLEDLRKVRETLREARGRLKAELRKRPYDFGELWQMFGDDPDLAALRDRLFAVFAEGGTDAFVDALPEFPFESGRGIGRGPQRTLGANPPVNKAWMDRLETAD